MKVFLRFLIQSMLWCMCVAGAVAETLLANAVPVEQIPPASDVQPVVDDELKNALMNAVNLKELNFNDQYDAQVWMFYMSDRLSRFVPDEKQRLELLTLIRQEAHLSGLQPEVVLSVIEVESRFDRYAVSRAGAQGIMQVMPFWKNEIGRPEDNLIKPDTNLRYGCTILKHYLDKEGGNLHKALARYNGSSMYGPYPEKVFDAFEKRWRGGAL